MASSELQYSSQGKQFPTALDERGREYKEDANHHGKIIASGILGGALLLGAGVAVKRLGGVSKTFHGVSDKAHFLADRARFNVTRLNTIRTIHPSVRKEWAKHYFGGHAQAVVNGYKKFEYGAGYASGLGVQAGSKVAQGAKSSYSWGKEALNYMKTHEIKYTPEKIVPRVLGAGAVGAVALGAVRADIDKQGMYRRDEDPSLKSYSLGASGQMVIDGSRAYRRRY